MGDFRSSRNDEFELRDGSGGGRGPSRHVEEVSEQSQGVLYTGTPKHMTTIYDNSYNDNSSHHYGDRINVTTHNHNAVLTGMDMRLNQARDLLLAHVSHGALHNSAQRGPDAPKCFPETRVAVQEEIHSWIKFGHRDTNPQTMLWLSGPAGSGKTAIAGSIADACYKEGLLAASFFFSSFAGDPDRCSKGLFIATLVYQLIQHDSLPGLREEVLAALDRDPLILKRNLDAQVDALLLNPLRKVFFRSSRQHWPLLVLVDGLDECAGDVGGDGAAQGTRKSREDNHSEILSALVRASNDPSFPFRIIVASRPEQAITRFFSSLSNGSFRRVFLDTKYNPKSDIELFLRAMMSKIGRDYHLQDDWYTYALPSDWSEYETRDVPSYLAKEASGQFVYASTVIRYVQDPAAGNTPIERLRHVLSSQRQSDSDNPFSALDALYAMILNTSPNPFLSATWLYAIDELPSQTPWSQSWIFKAILESTAGETEAVLGNLTSIVGLPTSGGKGTFRFYHKSLSDFLRDSERSAGLYVSDLTGDEFVEHRCYRTLKNRGPEVPLPSRYKLDDFLYPFCNIYLSFYNPEYLYNADDVEWWCSQDHYNGDIQHHFERVHRDCHWYHCRSSCKVWRKGVTQYCKAKGWRVPRWTELLQDRLKKFQIDFATQGDFPLRPPPQQDDSDSSLHLEGTPRDSEQNSEEGQEDDGSSIELPSPSPHSDDSN